MNSQISSVFDQLLTRSPEEIIILDGGMGTAVEDRNIDIQNSMWGSIALLTTEGRKINDEIHKKFVDAGAEILIANTHNSTMANCSELLHRNDFDCLEAIRTKGSEEQQASAINEFVLRAGMESARSAVPDESSIAVATCIGSVDLPYAIESSKTTEEVTEILEVEIAVRMEIGYDLLILETLTTPDEIKGAAHACLKCGAGNVGVGLSCGPDGKTWAGVSMQDAVEEFKDVNPLAYFIQCTHCDFVEGALLELKRALNPDVAFGVYANDGRDWDNLKMHWTGERISPEEYGKYALKWRDLGARMIGGCCGTRPEHISHLKTLFSPAVK